MCLRGFRLSGQQQEVALSTVLKTDKEATSVLCPDGCLKLGADNTRASDLLIKHIKSDSGDAHL